MLLLCWHKEAQWTLSTHSTAIKEWSSFLKLPGNRAVTTTVPEQPWWWMSWLYSIFTLAHNVLFSALQVTTLSALAKIVTWVSGSDSILGCLVGGSCKLAFPAAINLHSTRSHLTGWYSPFSHFWIKYIWICITIFFSFCPKLTQNN